ncbi:MAG: hypothetical protein QN720_13210 [Nitrososphaeraceae archaeon]|nr:hypothetical protein [Nitrososphaeraceae archaeon]MDW0333910.1 hypothetical protein [Nitrososphaeraceae archaeon]
MGKFTFFERTEIKSLVAELSIKRIPESLIISEIFKKTGKTISRVSLFKIKRSIKRESAKWYSQLRGGEYEYIHAFKERIDEIMWLQKKHYEIIDSNEENPSIQLTSLAALHKLNVTLSNYFAVVTNIGDTQKQMLMQPLGLGLGLGPDSSSTIEQQDQAKKMFRIDGCTCPHDGRDIISHSKCRHCLCIWCPTAMKQDWCPNPECSSGIAGCKFMPFDEHHKWIKCKCNMWFKTQEILDAHKQISFACQDIIV